MNIWLGTNTLKRKFEAISSLKHTLQNNNGSDAIPIFGDDNEIRSIKN